MVPRRHTLFSHTRMKRHAQPDDNSHGLIDVRDFILSVRPPPAVHAEALLEEVKDTMTPDQIREFITQHQYPPVWGAELELDLKLRLEAAGFSHVWCRCLDEHPVAEIRMRKAESRQLTVRALMRLLREMAADMGHRVARGSLVASIQGNRAEAAMVLESPAV